MCNDYESKKQFMEDKGGAVPLRMVDETTLDDLTRKAPSVNAKL